MQYFRIFIALIFLASGTLKLFSIDAIKYVLIQSNFTNWYFSDFFAGLIIGGEIAIAFLLLINFKTKTFTIPLVIVTLIAFTLFILIKDDGIECGCFGEFIEFSKWESVFKNIILILACCIFYFFNYKHPEKSKNAWLVLSGCVVSISLPFIFNDINLGYQGAEEINQPVDLSELPPLFETGEKINFSSGKKLVAFFSVNCSHCKKAATKLSILNKIKNELPVYCVFIGEADSIPLFFMKSNSFFPYISFRDKAFFKYSGNSIPSIIYIENGILRKRWVGAMFNPKEIEAL